MLFVHTQGYQDPYVMYVNFALSKKLIGCIANT